MSRRLVLGLALAAALPLTGCTGSPGAPPPQRPTSADMKLVAFDSCAELTNALRDAAKASVGPFGFPGQFYGPRAGGVVPDGARTMADSASAKGAPPVAPGFSGTNVHEAGTDEPDVVKTDGRRIVTYANGQLRVVDAATKREIGKLDIGDVNDPSLLLSGDRVLVLSRGFAGGIRMLDGPVQRPKYKYAGARAVLVDISAGPRVVSRFSTTAGLVDARQTGDTVRIVVNSQARISFPMSGGQDEEKRVTANREQIDKADVGLWLPQWSVVTGDTERAGTVPCESVSRPATFSGSSMLTVLTFGMSAPRLDDGRPVSVVADGDTVYGTATSLYVASDDRWRLDLWRGRDNRQVDQKTQLYRFEVRGAEPPVYRAGGEVPGFLINQYAMSEWDGHLRVATTDDTEKTSAVRVLRADDLEQVGVVDGLGKGERIYSVRFIGPRGYVVTFRQTDPLYSVDLSDPSAPRVTGELKITGVSSHLQPIGPDRLIGIGQEADENGRTQGTQISLFDVSDPAAPKRLARHFVPGGWSEAEHDPHAILWWPATELLVVPIIEGEPGKRMAPPAAGALALRVRGDAVTKAGDIAVRPGSDKTWQPYVRRTLVVGDDLWTLTDAGMQATALSTLKPVATVTF